MMFSRNIFGNLVRPARVLHQSKCFRGQKIHKVFDPDGNEIQMDPKRGFLKQEREAERIARSNLGGSNPARSNFGGSNPARSNFGSGNPARSNIAGGDDVAKPKIRVQTTEEEDSLPEGMKVQDLPSFQRIMGWDKQSKDLRRLKSMFSYNRKTDDMIILEGKRLIIDAIQAGFYPEVFVFSRLNLLGDIPFDKTQPLAMYQIPYRNIAAWSELSTHPGLMAAFRKSTITSSVHPAPDALAITLLLDNVRGPDNLGAIYRSAAAAGCKKIIAMHGCVDAWQPKVLRSAAGAHFHVPIETSVTWDVVHRHVPPFAKVVLADIVPSSEASDDVTTDDVTKEVMELEERCLDFRFSDESISNEHRDMSYFEPELIERFRALPLSTKRYWEFERSTANQEVVVIIGGETEGVSDSARQFTHRALGDRLFVPLKNNINSLSVVSAASIVLFDVQKKVLLGK